MLRQWSREEPTPGRPSSKKKKKNIGVVEFCEKSCFYKQVHGEGSKKNLIIVIVSSHCRRRFTNVCLDNICGYLVELQSLSPNSTLQQTIGNFKSLQAKLEKLHWRHGRKQDPGVGKGSWPGSSLHAFKEEMNLKRASLVPPLSYLTDCFVEKNKEATFMSYLIGFSASLEIVTTRKTTDWQDRVCLSVCLCCISKCQITSAADQSKNHQSFFFFPH